MTLHVMARSSGTVDVLAILFGGQVTIDVSWSPGSEHLAFVSAQIVPQYRRPHPH